MLDKGVMHPMVRYSTLSQMMEEDLAKADKVNRPQNVIPINGKRPKTLLGSLAEGGAIMPDQFDKTTPYNADIVVNLAKMR